MKSQGIVIVQNLIPDYRIKFFKHLKKKLNSRLLIYSGRETFDPTVTHSSKIYIDKSIKQFFLWRRKLVYQQLGLCIYYTKDIVILGLNPRIINTWLLLIVRGLLGRKTILWGHAWPRAGKDSATDIIRNFMRYLASEIITYTVSQKRELQEKMPRAKIRASSNALLEKEEMFYQLKSEELLNIIYVGRLVADKKVMKLYKAFNEIYKNLPPTTNLIIVGAGPQKEALQKSILKNNMEDRIQIKDAIFDHKILSILYAQSLVSVSPGYVGLNIIQSFGYGVPMVISKDEPHSPEIEAANEFENVIYFDSNDEKALAKSLLEVFENKNYWILQRESIYKACTLNYSIQRMCKPFIEILND